MSWGTELWDQTDSIAAYVQKGIDFCEKFSHFLREKCSLENEYASKLKQVKHFLANLLLNECPALRLVKSYQPKRKDEDCEFTCTRGFQEMICEMTDMAGQHEWIAENLTNSTMKSLQLLIQQIKNDKRKYLQENSKQNSNMQSQWNQLDKFRRQYDKAFKESEKARELFNKADADINLSRAEVERARTFMTQKQTSCETAKGEYKAELQKTNEYQREHFDKLIPEIIQRLQDLEESRINSMMSLYKECVDTERKVMPIISKCIDGMEKASSLVSSSADVKVVIDKYKSGFLPPGDIVFEELTSDNSGSSEKISPAPSVSSLTKGDAGKSKPTVAPAKAKKKPIKILGLFGSTKSDEAKEDFSHLPPNQQKKKLIQQINSIKALVSKEVAERDGLLKMQDAYQKNPSLGDAQSLGKQMEESAQKLDQLHSEMRKFQKYLADIDGTAHHQETGSSATKNSQDHFQPVLPSSKEEQDNQSLQSSEFDNQDIFGGSDLNLNVAAFDRAKECPSDTSDGSFDGPDEPSSVATGFGVGTALYSYTADNEHSLSMALGEQFAILEQDQGDGWMRVRNSSGAEGYVPSSYMQCHMNHSFNSSGGFEFSGSGMEIAYEADDNYQELDSLYASSMAAQYCQPYLDHSYASQLPMAASAPDIASLTVPEPLTSYIDIEDVSCHTTVITAPLGGGSGGGSGGGGGGSGVGKIGDDSSSDPWEGSVTRCICDFLHDDGYMICCDRCGVWQHVDCMGVDRNNIPDSYLCELCSPRLVDKRRAIRLQTLKKEQMDMEVSASDSSTEERYGAGKRGGKRQGMGRKHRDSQSGIPQKKPIRRRAPSEPVDDKAAEAKKNAQLAAPKRTRRSTLDSHQNVTIDHSREEQCQNTYSSGVLLLLATLKQTDVATAGNVSASFNPSILKEQTSKQRYRVAQYEPDIKGVEAAEAVRAGQAVAEYTGHVMMADEYQPGNQLNMYVPFLLQYPGNESFRFSFYIDSSSFVNDIRFIRSSCTPNAKVLHVVEPNAVRFFVCATKSIAEGREVTIPFSYDYTKSSNEVKCACNRAACPIARFFKSKTNSRPVRTGRGKSLSSNSEEEKSKTDVVLTATASLAVASTEKAAAPSSIKQRRRSSLRAEMQQQDHTINQDVSADINLINKLTAAAVQRPVPRVALTSNCASETRAISNETWKNHESPAAANQFDHPTLPAEDHDDADGGSLVIAFKESSPSRKTREQKKIEAVEKAFEKIEKVNARVRDVNQRTKSAKAKTQNEKGVNEERGKKTPNAKNKNLHNSETNQADPKAATNGSGRTSVRAKRQRGKPQPV